MRIIFQGGGGSVCNSQPVDSAISRRSTIYSSISSSQVAAKRLNRQCIPTWWVTVGDTQRVDGSTNCSNHLQPGAVSVCSSPENVNWGPGRTIVGGRAASVSRQTAKIRQTVLGQRWKVWWKLWKNLTASHGSINALCKRSGIIRN